MSEAGDKCRAVNKQHPVPDMPANGVWRIVCAFVDGDTPWLAVVDLWIVNWRLADQSQARYFPLI